MSLHCPPARLERRFLHPEHEDHQCKACEMYRNDFTMCNFLPKIMNCLDFIRSWPEDVKQWTDMYNALNLTTGQASICCMVVTLQLVVLQYFAVFNAMLQI